MSSSESTGYGDNYGSDYGGEVEPSSTSLGTTQLGSRDLGGAEVTSTVSGDAESLTSASTDRITRRRFGVTGTTSVAATTATTDFARVGAFVPQDLDEYFPTPLPSRGRSTLSGIVDATQTVHGQWSDSLDTIEQSHHIEEASGGNLDEIGAMFGQIGNRRKRDDGSYREFLRGVAQSFSGRGTVPGVRTAVAAAIRADPSSIELNEDFTSVAYSLAINDWRQHKVASVSEVADLSDASGTEFVTPTTYVPGGYGVPSKLGPATYETLFDLDGITATSDVGPVSAGIVREGLGSGTIGDGTQVGPEESIERFNKIGPAETRTVEDGDTAEINGSLEQEGTLVQKGTIQHN